eukprot:7391761-Prymnesium_polylepis.1
MSCGAHTIWSCPRRWLADLLFDAPSSVASPITPVRFHSFSDAPFQRARAAPVWRDSTKRSNASSGEKSTSLPLNESLPVASASMS